MEGQVENYTICSTVLIQTFFVVGITEVIPLSVITVCYSIFLQYKFVASCNINLLQSQCLSQYNCNPQIRTCLNRLLYCLVLKWQISHRKFLIH